VATKKKQKEFCKRFIVTTVEMTQKSAGGGVRIDIKMQFSCNND